MHVLKKIIKLDFMLSLMLILVLFIKDRCNVNKSHLRESNGTELLETITFSGLLLLIDKQSEAVFTGAFFTLLGLIL